MTKRLETFQIGRLGCALLAAVSVPTVAAAQGGPVVEIGTGLGAAIQSAAGATLTHIGVPGQGILGQPTIYASFFPGGTVLVEPQIALNIISSGGETLTTIGLGGQLGYLFRGAAINSPFIAAAFAYQSVSGGGASAGEAGAGGKAGYRVLIGSGVGLRIEAGYRRWFDSHINEFTIGIGIGAIVHGSQ